MNCQINNITRSTIRFVLALFVATVCLIDHADAQAIKKSDHGALEQIIGEDIFGRNARGVIRTARNMGDDAKQYEYLANWVLASGRQSPLRLQGYFTTTNPIPSDSDVGADSKIESPAMELIRVAKRTGKLDDLFDQVSKVPDGDASLQLRKNALLGLIELAGGQIERVQKRMDVFYELATKNDVPMTQRWPELLLLNATSRVPALKEVTKEIFDVMRPAHAKLRDTPIGIHMQVIAARVEFGASESLKRWHPSTRASQKSNGRGNPNGRWHFSDKGVKGLVSNDVDFLHYQIPLTGDYAVEAEVSMVPRENGVLFVGGRWLSVTGPSGKYRGDHRSNMGYKHFKPIRMPKPAQWSRYRTTVRGGEVVTTLNGREIDQHESKYAPWVGIRNNSTKRTTVRNLRIAGQPVIPTTVYPLKEGVQSWKTYHGDTDPRWKSSDDHPNGFLKGRRLEKEDRFPSESLTHYHRAIVEDGVIEYEFFYKAGESTAHPAIERLVFLLGPGGVRLRWIDDGVHDQSIDFADHDSNVVSGPLELKENAWNRVRLTFDGEQMVLAVNDRDAYTHTVIQRQRRLGLFYNAHESSLQVRDMAWKGDWPKQLPPSLQQELAEEQLACLEGVDSWQEHSRIRFNQPIDSSQFDQPIQRVDTTILPTGLRIEAKETPSWTGHQVSAKRPIFGDFDATLRFANLLGVSETSRADLVLRFVDQHGNRYGTSRSFHSDHGENVELKTMVIGKDNSKIWHSENTGDEASEGTLRLVRRDDMVYSLIAYGESDRFHLIASKKVYDPSSPAKLNAEISRNGKSKISVELQELIIRTRPPGQRKRDPRVAVLDRLVQNYKRRYFQDFSKPGELGLVSFQQGTTTTTGVELNAKGSPATMTCQHPTSGDFDVAINLGKLELSENGTLAISMRVGDVPKRLELSVQTDSGEGFQVVARSQTENGTAKELGSFKLKAVQSLRMARVQRTVFFVCESETVRRVVGFADVGTASVHPGSIQVVVASEATPSRAHVNSLSIRSTR